MKINRFFGDFGDFDDFSWFFIDFRDFQQKKHFAKRSTFSDPSKPDKNSSPGKTNWL